MKIRYTPKDNPEAVEEISVDIEKLMVGEVKLLEKTLAMTIQEIGEMLSRGSFTHMMALVWVYRRRTDRDLRLDDMDDIAMSELVPVYSDEEQQDLDGAAGDGDPKASDEVAQDRPAVEA